MTEKTPLENWIRESIFPRDSQLYREKLDAYQLTAFKENINYVKINSPFYKKHLAEVEAEKLKTIEDINNVPFTFPEDLRAYNGKMICVSQSEISRVVTLDTSGTSGAPKRIYFTPEDQELTVDFFNYGMSVFTKRNDRVLILLPGSRPGSLGELLEAGLKRIPAEGIIYGVVEDFEKAESIILDKSINVIVGIPQQVLALCCMDRAHLIKEKGCLHSVLLSTDYVPEASVQNIKKRWGCRVYEHYGMTEMGLGGGVNCKSQSGYHLREADMLFEIIDPVTEKTLPDGEYGEVVFTTLTRKGMPLIRYRTGDISRFLKEPCECGTILKTMEKIKYRVSSAVSLKNGYLLTMPELDESLFKIDGIVDFFAETRVTDGAECLVLYINSLPSCSVLDARIKDALLESRMKDIILRGELKIDIRKAEGSTPDIKGTGKRKIKDLRI